MRTEALTPPALAHHPLRPGAPWPSCCWPPQQWAAQPGKGTSLRGRAAGPRNNTLAPPIWSPGSWQPGRGLRSALTARLHESSPGPTGQSCPKISLRPGRAGGRRRCAVGPGHLRGSPQARALVPQALSLEPGVRGPTEEPRAQSTSAGPLAVQNGLPVVRPGVQPAAWGLQLHVPIVAGCEEDVLPAGLGLGPCGQESSTQSNVRSLERPPGTSSRVSSVKQLT